MQLLYEEATDVTAAVAFLSQCPFVDPKRIAIGGHSTGEFITIVAAARLPELGAVVSINGGISWRWDGVQVGHDATEKMFAREASKIRTPVLVLVGSRDEQIPLSVGLHLAEVLRSHSKPVELRICQGDHMSWPVAELIGFLDKHLKPQTR